MPVEGFEPAIPRGEWLQTARPARCAIACQFYQIIECEGSHLWDRETHICYFSSPTCFGLLGLLQGLNVMSQNVMLQNVMSQNVILQNVMSQNVMSQNLMLQNPEVLEDRVIKCNSLYICDQNM